VAGCEPQEYGRSIDWSLHKKGSGRNGNKREEIELSEFQMRNEGPKRLGSRNRRGIASDVKKKWDFLEL
jgi:hypothetical protein